MNLAGARGERSVEEVREHAGRSEPGASTASRSGEDPRVCAAGCAGAYESRIMGSGGGSKSITPKIPVPYLQGKVK